jgi:hypothetical protein
VITMSMICKTRPTYFRERKSVREIVRLTRLLRNTVRKWLKAMVMEEPKYRRGVGGELHRDEGRRCLRQLTIRRRQRLRQFGAGAHLGGSHTAPQQVRVDAVGHRHRRYRHAGAHARRHRVRLEFVAVQAPAPATADGLFEDCVHVPTKS